ncbi:deoxynucleoside triphosphate triphosphohydrolase SAMHD1-like [Diadema setosum]|uniref:deoxynucleoside triphosphate triphosphohydrolase SAMHD1-like n=1 Tax=Diadema setosum TaxID=31175 RepID=UPI003B3A0166
MDQVISDSAFFTLMESRYQFVGVVRRWMFDNYTCFAENTEGSDNHTIELLGYSNIDTSTKTINDAIHGIIEIPPYCMLIIDTPEFQRLRDIKQLGPVCFVYPCAVHTRFDHSLGVCHMAGVLARRLKADKTSKMTEVDVRCVEIAGLCHDLGHGPLSHTYQEFIEEQGKDWKHEEQSVRILRHLIEANNLYGELRRFRIDDKEVHVIFQLIDVKNTEKEDLIPPHKFFLKQIVNNSINGIDVDKWDYVARDARLLGIPSAFEVERVLKFVKACYVKRNDEEKRKEICFRDKVASDLNHLFLTRRRLHYAAYHHRVTTSISIMYRHAFRLAYKHLKFQGKNEMFNLLDCWKDEEAFCKATDVITRDIMGSKSTNPGMEKAQRIIRRIYSRQLYQCIIEITHAKGKVRSDDPKEIRKYLVADDNAQPEDKQVWNKDRLFVEVSIFDYGMGSKNPFHEIPVYKKSQENEEAEPLTPQKIPADVPHELEDMTVRIYTSVTGADLTRARKYYEKNFKHLILTDR